ncbi:MAG: hypothetical protein NZ927_05780 [Candidatus Calescibacterium sp.]|nr:hypothetical protein [Candidatus Calescibacterium sp.]
MDQLIRRENHSFQKLVRALRVFLGGKDQRIEGIDGGDAESFSRGSF